MKRCYVVLVNWNGWADTLECLESLFCSDYAGLRVVVCDNGSVDHSLEFIRNWASGHQVLSQATEGPLKPLPPVAALKPIPVAEYSRTQAEEGGDVTLDPPLVLIDIGANLGFAGGNNVGLRYLMARSDFDYVWLLNNDTVVDPGALRALVSRMVERPDAGMCGSTLLRYRTPEKIQARGGGWYCKWIGLPWHIGQLENANVMARQGHVEKWMNYVVGASMLVSRDFLQEVGLMNEDYFLYFEELDWILRARGHFALAYAPQSIIYHKVGASIGTSTDPRKKSLVCDYYNIRNRIRFTHRYYPAALLTIYPLLCFAIFSRLLSGQWNRALMILRLMLSRGADLENFKLEN